MVHERSFLLPTNEQGSSIHQKELTIILLEGSPITRSQPIWILLVLYHRWVLLPKLWGPTTILFLLLVWAVATRSISHNNNTTIRSIFNAAATKSSSVSRSTRAFGGGGSQSRSCFFGFGPPLSKSAAPRISTPPPTTAILQRQKQQQHPAATSSSGRSRDMTLSAAATDNASLSDFLFQCKDHPSGHFVIGNEAGDADSVVCALSWAFVENLMSQPDNISTSSKRQTPIVSISKMDLETQRPETLLLLSLAGISLDTLLYVNDLKAMIPTQSKSVEFTLVDHNRLSSNLVEDGQYKVVEIVDHHKDEGLYLDTVIHRSIAFANGQALVASTCTLVVERWIESVPPSAPHFPAALSVLLLGVILLDSVNMAPAAGKVTERDTAAIQSLLQHTTWTDLNDDAKQVLQLEGETHGRPRTTAFFNALQNAKFAPEFWRSLSVRDALRLDYKHYYKFTTAIGSDRAGDSFGISTVLMSCADFQTKPHLQQGILDYLTEMNVGMLGIMLAFTNNKTGGLHRELMLCSNVSTLPLQTMAKFLHASSLQLTEIPGSSLIATDGLRCMSFIQENTKASRKQVAPIFLQYFEKS